MIDVRRLDGTRTKTGDKVLGKTSHGIKLLIEEPVKEHGAKYHEGHYTWKDIEREKRKLKKG
ncbi:MAG: hypothetical protein ABIH20_03460 [Candidatus Diapherotrites archaeon]